MKNCRLVFPLVAAALACCAEWDGYMMHVASNYNFQSWCGMTETNYPHALSEWSMPTIVLPTNDVPGVTAQLSSADHLTELFLFSGTNGDMILRVSCAICTNVVEAHESIIDRLSTMASPIMHKFMTNDVGDVCFSYPSPAGCFSSVTFARNNVMVCVFSRVAEIPATNVASQIDMDLRANSIMIAPTE